MSKKAKAMKAFQNGFSKLGKCYGFQYTNGIYRKVLPEMEIIKYVHLIPTIEGGWNICYNIKTPLDYLLSFKDIQNEGIYSLFHYVWYINGQYPGLVKGNSMSEWEKSYKLAQLRSIGYIEITDWNIEYKDLMEMLEKDYPSIDEIMYQRYIDFEGMVLQDMEKVIDIASCHAFHTKMMKSTYRGIWDEKRLMWYAIFEGNYNMARKYICQYIEKSGNSIDEQDDAFIFLSQLENSDYTNLQKELEEMYNAGVRFIHENYQF